MTDHDRNIADVGTAETRAIVYTVADLPIPRDRWPNIERTTCKKCGKPTATQDDCFFASEASTNEEHDRWLCWHEMNGHAGCQEDDSSGVKAQITSQPCPDTVVRTKADMLNLHHHDGYKVLVWEDLIVYEARTVNNNEKWVPYG